MEMNQLRCFLAVVEHGTFTAAAACLGVAQPAVSQSISRLETDIGTRLLQRTRKGAELTAAGKAFLEDVVDGMGILEGAVLRARERARGKAGRLTIGVVSSALYDLVPDALALLRRDFPQIDVVIQEMGNHDQINALRASTIDIGFLHPPFQSSAWLKEQTLREEKLIAAVPRDFPHGDQAKINFRHLGTHGLITFPETLLPGTRVGLTTAYRRAGIPFRVTQEVKHTLTALSCVSSGLGIALLPESVRNVKFRDVRYVEIIEDDALPRSVISAVWRSSTKSTTADHLIALLRLPTD